MKVFFRVDSATRIGGGHLMRCITLAETLRAQGAQVSFVCRELPGNLIALVKTKGFPVLVLPSPSTYSGNSIVPYSGWLGVSQKEDALETQVILADSKPDWLIVDHYSLDIIWEKILRPYCSRIMVIDDLANRKHDCDVILDQNFSLESDARYKDLVPNLCKILLGPKYALLKNEFQILRSQKERKNKSLDRILVFFTTGDDQGQTLKAMKGIIIFGKTKHVDVVIGNENPDAEIIKKMCLTQRWSFHCQVEYMPSLIAKADLIIGAGGSSNWERCAVGTPAIIIILAENQAAIAHALDSAEIVINLGWNTNIMPEDYAEALTQITPERLAVLSENALRLVDGKGSQRVLEILAT